MTMKKKTSHVVVNSSAMQLRTQQFQKRFLAPCKTFRNNFLKICCNSDVFDAKVPN